MERVVRSGTLSAPRGKRVIERRVPTVFQLNDIRYPFVISEVRAPKYRFGITEAAWILGGRDDIITFEGINSRMKEFSDDGQTLWGAYGPRLVEQLDRAVATLLGDRSTRQAVITTWRPIHDPTFKSKDVPCTVALHFQMAESEEDLNLTVFMRSNDVWLGLPYDILTFTTILRVVASMIGCNPGKYFHVVSNLHLYQEHWESARLLLRDEPDATPKRQVSVPQLGAMFKGWSAAKIAALFGEEGPPTEVFGPNVLRRIRENTNDCAG